MAIKDFSEAYRQIVLAINDGETPDLSPIQNWHEPLARLHAHHIVSPRDMIRIFRRDNFVCRYCMRRTVFLPVLRLIYIAFPDRFGYEPHWTIPICHLGFWRDSASCDHVIPAARGGGASDDNLATACYMCNSIKQAWLIEDLGWTLNPPAERAWDGLLDLFPPLLDSLRKRGLTQQHERYLKTWENAMQYRSAERRTD